MSSASPFGHLRASKSHRQRVRPARARPARPATPTVTAAFLIVLGTKFLPGVMFGPGIVWDGIGGLYGHDRRADTDALRERLTAGAVGNVLFADDPVRNAPVLLGDLATLFPSATGVQVFGLTGQFGWIQAGRDYLIRAAVGVIIEYNQRITRVVILGSADGPHPEQTPRRPGGAGQAGQAAVPPARRGRGHRPGQAQRGDRCDHRARSGPGSVHADR
ncbi:MAG: DUF6603 domain-containing protein [Nocardioidaceae bacterium]